MTKQAQRAAQLAAQNNQQYPDSYQEETTPNSTKYQLFNLDKGKTTDKVLLLGKDNVVKELPALELLAALPNAEALANITAQLIANAQTEVGLVSAKNTQNFTNAEKEQARQNINADNPERLDNFVAKIDYQNQDIMQAFNDGFNM